MKQMKNMKIEKPLRKYLHILIPIGICLLYFTLNLFFISDFPFVHSDETWLSGLSRTMMETGKMSATEYFFDLYERNPHAVKILFHTAEISWISLFGYSIQTIRILSLLVSTVTLFLLFQVIFKITQNRLAAILGMIFMALDIQFIYASHTARQEIWLILILLSTLNLLVKSYSKIADSPNTPWRYSTDIAAGVVLGLSFGFHPNGMVILFPVLGYYVYYLFLDWKPVMKKSLAFIGVFGITASVFLILSLIFNSHFFTDYAAYGKSLGVLESTVSKISGWLDFYKKLFFQVSGTYYTPNIKPQFFLFGVITLGSFIIAGFQPLSRRRLIPLLVGLVGMQAAFILIGRYGQPSVVLNLPVLVITAAVLCTELLNIRRKIWIKYTGIACCVLIVLGSGLFSGYQIKEETSQNTDYNEYLDQISDQIPSDAAVLCNINAEPLFDYGKLYDWRNIGELSGNDQSFSQYISDRNIEYIVYPEEIDYIYQHRPLWNGVYGNIALIYDGMQDFLNNQCEVIGVFSSRTYAMRIVRYQQEREWNITLYRVFP
jgi:4-amino-4-deoxy-L-arabinose transferase-like glycosyltransferase